MNLEDLNWTPVDIWFNDLTNYRYINSLNKISHSKCKVLYLDTDFTYLNFLTQCIKLNLLENYTSTSTHQPPHENPGGITGYKHKGGSIYRGILWYIIRVDYHKPTLLYEYYTEFDLELLKKKLIDKILYTYKIIESVPSLKHTWDMLSTDTGQALLEL